MRGFSTLATDAHVTFFCTYTTCKLRCLVALDVQETMQTDMQERHEKEVGALTASLAELREQGGGGAPISRQNKEVRAPSCC